MAIDKNIGEEITLKEAIDFTHAFQTQNPDELKSFFVGINKLNLILEQTDCIGLRIYNGVNPHKKQELISFFNGQLVSRYNRFHAGKYGKFENDIISIFC